jgi:serine/threonine-protein kinase
MAPATENWPPMRLIEIARDQGKVTDAQVEMIRTEHTQTTAQGRGKSPTRIAIEHGILSDQDVHDIETEAWIRELPSDLDEYRIVRLVGRGGMAVVFEAQDVSLGKTLAIKLLLPEFASSDSYLARFHREARIAAKLTHPNVVQVFRAGEKEGMQFLVMEFVEGEPISAILRRVGRIPERSALDAALQVSGALEEAASLGIIHRDVKPGNILMSKKWGVPKLADFGIAKEFSDIRDARIQQSLTMGVVGTPTFMSPEQARGARDIDFRSDIYSLGATLYHMAIGDLPFPASTPQETMVRVAAESPRLPRAAFPELSESASAVICKMMAKRAADRYASYPELRADLAAAREGRPASIGYEEACRLMAPAARPEEIRAPGAGGGLPRILAIAGAVTIVGLALLLLMMRGCS